MINRNAGSDAGNFIKEPGEYVAKILETKAGMSKNGKKMLTVLFHTKDERQIKSYFVGELAFHMKALAALKVASGLEETDRAERLIGRECGILVEPQEPDSQTGRVFMQITGYGKASDVTGINSKAGPSDFDPPPPGDDDVPF